MSNIILAYGLDDQETRDAVQETVDSYDGDVMLAALDYTDANPNASLQEIAAAIEEALVGVTDKRKKSSEPASTS